VIRDRDRCEVRLPREGDDLRRGELAVAGGRVDVQVGPPRAGELREAGAECREWLASRH
jgi:hypothetical protein